VGNVNLTKDSNGLDVDSTVDMNWLKDNIKNFIADNQVKN
jgi:hypothetical protein